MLDRLPEAGIRAPWMCEHMWRCWHAGPLLRNNPSARGVSMRAELGPGRVAGSYACLSLAEVTLADGSTRTYQVMRSARFDAKQLGEALIALGWQVVATVPYDSRSASMILRRA